LFAIVMYYLSEYSGCNFSIYYFDHKAVVNWVGWNT
jgi:hypothetical protein